MNNTLLRGQQVKVIRFISQRNEELFGIYRDDTWAEIIYGNIFGSYLPTGQHAKIKQLLPPLLPVDILAVGLNYRDHADEVGMTYPDLPILFIKATSSVIGHGDTILLPAAGPDQVDYEAELAIIIGKKAKNVPPERALDYIFGYTCANDISARDWQIEKQKRQWARGKSFDTFCPLGPWIITKEEIVDPQSLQIRTIINGEVLQDSNTANMIFSVTDLISDLSRSITLLPGTVILTGTPKGVGFTRNPPVFLKEGDEVTVEIEKIGRLTNRVQRET